MLIDLDDDLSNYTLALARQCNLDYHRLIAALTNEDSAALADLLGRDQPSVIADLQEVHRALVIDGDWGAGCAILTAEVRAIAEAALATLLTGRSTPDAILPADL
ncbi:MAG: hypothetical protein H0X37_18380 [Herpetosiphonaceae bacterium]|nr:hypothetical protein [Herpetosiphonaceae bacterium]